jgi:hypothetical protein
VNRAFIFVTAISSSGSYSGWIMTALDESGRRSAEDVGLEKAGAWLMGVYWLALLAVLVLGGLAAG